MNAIKPWTLLRLLVYVWASSIGHGKERLRDCTNSRHSAILLKGLHRKTWWLKKEKKNTDICDLTCRFFLWIEEKARTPNVIAEKMKTAMITAKTFWDLFNMERRYLTTEASWRSILIRIKPWQQSSCDDTDHPLYKDYFHCFFIRLPCVIF